MTLAGMGPPQPQEVTPSLGGQPCASHGCSLRSDFCFQILGSSSRAADLECWGLFLAMLEYSTARNGPGVDFGLGWVLT